MSVIIKDGWMLNVPQSYQKYKKLPKQKKKAKKREKGQEKLLDTTFKLPTITLCFLGQNFLLLASL
jgi:hypothetical protein